MGFYHDILFLLGQNRYVDSVWFYLPYVVSRIFSGNEYKNMDIVVCMCEVSLFMDWKKILEMRP